MPDLMSSGFGHCILLVLLILAKEGQASDVDEYIRQKREVECEEKYKTIVSDHSACKERSNDVQASGVSSDDRTTILAHHNRARREVSPTATDMMKMTWDDEIANTAQRWAENCNFNHDENYKRYAYGRFTVGQNLAMGYSDWSSAMQGWENEKLDYDYTTNGSPTGKKIGHYTQMVWAKSSKIGCGFARCGTTNYYVCNYGPAGNSGTDKPYTSGDKCAVCPNKCDDGLCDCGGVVCLNGGTMDFSTCECNCRPNLPFFFAPTCGLNCEGNRQASYCNQYGANNCPVFSNVPQECPVMCNWCPTAAYKASTDSTTSTEKPTEASTTSTKKTTATSTPSSTEKSDSSTPKVTEAPPITTTAKAHTVVANMFICLFVAVISLLV